MVIAEPASEIGLPICEAAARDWEEEQQQQTLPSILLSLYMKTTAFLNTRSDMNWPAFRRPAKVSKMRANHSPLGEALHSHKKSRFAQEDQTATIMDDSAIFFLMKKKKDPDTSGLEQRRGILACEHAISYGHEVFRWLHHLGVMLFIATGVGIYGSQNTSTFCTCANYSTRMRSSGERIYLSCLRCRCSIPR